MPAQRPDLRWSHFIEDAAEGRQIKSFTAECYWPGLTPEAVGGIAESARAASAALAGPAEPIHFVGTLLFVRDEVLFVLFRAVRESQVRAVGELARLPFDRVAESLLDLFALCAPTPPSEEQVMTGHPDDFESFRASRSRFFDSLAADSLLFNIERAAAREATMTYPIVMEGELTILSGEGRLVFDHSTPAERDVSDVLGDALGFRRRGPGVDHVGPVRITVDRLGGGRGTGR